MKLGFSIRNVVSIVLLVALSLVGLSVINEHVLPKVVNQAVELGLSSVVAEVMPTVVHIMYEADSDDYYGGRIKWQGSGVIVSKSGLVLTARHVCEKPGKFTVTLSDGREFITNEACVSRKYDVGFLKIADANDFPTAKFGDSDKMLLGSRLLAIGSPWGKQHFNSVTLGILSSLSRGRSNAGWGWEVLFQTDVTANPGNSGGPVFNISGEIVGIVVGLYGPGNYVGITYCVPSNICKSFVQSAELVFAQHEVAIVEDDKRMDAIKNQLTSIVNDMYDVKRRLSDIEFELTEPESFESEENYEGYEYWEQPWE